MIWGGVRVFLATWLIAGMTLPAFASAAGVPVVQDLADILSPEQESELEQYGIRLHDATTAELALLTIPSIGDEPVEEYAVKKLREFKLGQKDKDNGALLVVTTEKNSAGNRHFELTVGYGLEGALPDGKVGRIMDEVAVPYLHPDENRPDLAIMEAYKAYYNEIAAEYGLEGDQLPVSTVYGEYDNSDGGFPFILYLIIIFIIINIVSRMGRGGGGSGGRGGGGGSPIFFSGSFGGGSSGGGGFGGFGGGGSGGGGGAGRSW